MSTPNSQRHWLWYSISYLAATFIAIDCAINALYYMHHLNYGILLIILAATSGYALNKMLYANDGPRELSAMLSLSNIIGSPGDGMKRRLVIVFANLVALGSGLAMGAFTMTSYMALLPSLPLINMPFAIVCSIAYMLGTYALIRRPLMDDLLGGSIETTRPNIFVRMFNWIRSGSIQSTHKGSWWGITLRVIGFLGLWSLTMLAMALSVEQFGIGTMGFLSHHFGLQGIALMAAGVSLMTLLTIGEIVFNSNTAFYLLEQSTRAVNSIKKVNRATFQRVWHAVKQRPQNLALGALALGMIVLNGFGNGAIASGSGFLSAHLPLMACALLGTLLSVIVMSKAVVAVPQDTDGALPRNHPNAWRKGGAFAITLITCMGAGMAIDYVHAGHALLLPNAWSLPQQALFWGLAALAVSAFTWVLFNPEPPQLPQLKPWQAISSTLRHWGTAAPASQNASPDPASLSPQPGDGKL